MEPKTKTVVVRRLLTYTHIDCGFWMLNRSIADGKIAALVAGRDLFEGRGKVQAA